MKPLNAWVPFLILFNINKVNEDHNTLYPSTYPPQSTTPVHPNWNRKSFSGLFLLKVSWFLPLSNPTTRWAPPHTHNPQRTIPRTGIENHFQGFHNELLSSSLGCRDFLLGFHNELLFLLQVSWFLTIKPNSTRWIPPHTHNPPRTVPYIENHFQGFQQRTPVPPSVIVISPYQTPRHVELIRVPTILSIRPTNLPVFCAKRKRRGVIRDTNRKR